MKLRWDENCTTFFRKIGVNKIFTSFFETCVSFNLFVLVCYFIYLLFSFLLKGCILLKDSVSPVLALKRTSLQPTKLYYILLVFLCRMENSCPYSLHGIAFFWVKVDPVKKMAAINVTSFNKTDVRNSPQKCLLLSRWLEFL